MSAVSPRGLATDYSQHMARKRKTLPKDFHEILASGDLDAMKAVYDKCLLEATTDYYKHTALAVRECPPELARWLVEQGLDVDRPDRFDATPLATAAGWGDVESMQLLLELGANPDAGKKPPLVAAARNRRLDAVRLLLDHGADVHAVEGTFKYTAADLAVAENNPAHLPEVVETLAVLLAAGTPLTDEGRRFVTRLGKEHARLPRDKMPDDWRDTLDTAMAELYRLSGVTPVPPIEPHDGTSRITVPDLSVPKQFSWLWDHLVPMSGPAHTVQGEMIRITGRIGNELLNNGGANWDNDFRAMCDVWLATVGDHADAIAVLRRGRIDEDAIDTIEAASVRYVINHPDPVATGDLPYQR